MAEKETKAMDDPAQSNGVLTPGVLDAELLADFGHQVRNQLNAVVGAAGLLSTGAGSSEERELASIVEIGAEQIARLVDDVLDAATIQSGSLSLPCIPSTCVEVSRAASAWSPTRLEPKAWIFPFSASPTCPE